MAAITGADRLDYDEASTSRNVGVTSISERREAVQSVLRKLAAE